VTTVAPKEPHDRTLVLSYLAIRRSIGVLALVLPPTLWPGGWLVFGIDLQENMSSYYHTPLRDVFVGVMCAIGIFLVCYRGYDWIENWTANVACLAALGVALCPMDPNSDPLQQTTPLGYLHTFFGGLFFSTLAFYSLYHFPRGSKLLRFHSRTEQRDSIYRATGLTILGCMVAMGMHLFLAPPGPKAFFNRYHFTFWMEWIAVWAFAPAWLTKGRAILADVDG
jgi:hypothetical protein